MLGLRLYSTNAFDSLNKPLRDAQKLHLAEQSRQSVRGTFSVQVQGGCASPTDRTRALHAALPTPRPPAEGPASPCDSRRPLPRDAVLYRRGDQKVARGRGEAGRQGKTGSAPSESRTPNLLWSTCPRTRSFTVRICLQVARNEEPRDGFRLPEGGWHRERAQCAELDTNPLPASTRLLRGGSNLVPCSVDDDGPAHRRAILQLGERSSLQARHQVLPGPRRQASPLAGGWAPTSPPRQLMPPPCVSQHFLALGVPG